MRNWIALLALTSAAGETVAADYDKIERRLVNEPVYSQKPCYGLLLFGPEARPVWVVLDGATLYLDRNGNGNLTERNERFASESDCKDVELDLGNKGTRYVVTKAASDHTVYTPEARRKRADEGTPPCLTVHVHVKGPNEFHQYCDLNEMCDDPKEAQLAHFDGPLTIGLVTVNWKIPDSTVLHTADKPSELRVVVGTMSARHGCWVVVQSCDDNRYCLPDDAHPVAEIEFPPLDPQDAPIKETYRLDDYCCSAIFKGPIQVPKQAGVGTASVRLSFDAWTTAGVCPSTVEIPIVE